MNGLKVGQDLFLDGCKEHPASFADIDLGNARIERQLSIVGATVAGQLKMSELQVGHALLMRTSDDGQPCEVHNDLDLSYATISGIFNLGGANLAGTLTLDHARSRLAFTPQTFVASATAN